jgi:hypothetical protein
MEMRLAAEWLMDRPTVWAAVEEVANALIARRRLPGAEVVKIVQKAMGKADELGQGFPSRFRLGPLPD